MIYILIMIISAGTQTNAITTQEFTSKEKCEIALNRIIDSKLIDNRWTFRDYNNKSVFFCVEK